MTGGLVPSSLLQSHRVRVRERHRLRGLDAGDGSFVPPNDDDDLERERDEAAASVEAVLGSLLSLPCRWAGEDGRASDRGVVRRIEVVLFHEGGGGPSVEVEADADASVAVKDERDDVDKNDDEWRAGLTLLRELLDLPPPSSNAASPPVTGDSHEGFGRSYLVPPHALFRSVADAALSIDDLQLATDDDDDVGDGGGDGDRPVNPEQHRTAVASLLVVIAFGAVRSESLRALSGDDAAPAIRWKRFRSTAFEAVALYQRAVLGAFSSRSWSWREGDIIRNLTVAVELLCRHVVPSCELAAMAMSGDGGAGKGLRPELVAAGAVSSALRCCDLIATYDEEGGERNSDLMSDVVRSLAGMGASLRINDILLHPIRRQYYKSKQWRMDRNDLGFWVCGDRGQDEEGEHVDRDDEEEEEDDREVLCGMDTFWDGPGVSHVALRLFLEEEKSSAGESQKVSLPCVYSPQYMFALVYPHLVSSIERALEASGSEDDYDGDEEMEIIDQHNDRRESARRSIEALQRLLQKATPMDGGNAQERRRRGYLAEVLQDVDGPLSPVGCVQLLLNLMVSESSKQNDVVSRGNRNPPQFGQGGGAAMIMLPGQVLGVIRILLSKYPPSFIAGCVGTLLERSPYPSVEPLLLDLLRPALAFPVSTDDEAATGDADTVTREVLNITAPYLEKMGRHCKVVEVISDEGDSDPDGSSGSGRVENHSSLADAEGLLDAAEAYTCAAALLRLVRARLRRARDARSSVEVAASSPEEPPRLSDAVDVVRDLRTCLGAELGRWSEAEERSEGRVLAGPDVEAPPPQGYHRLFLLEDALGEVLRSHGQK